MYISYKYIALLRQKEASDKPLKSWGNRAVYTGIKKPEFFSHSGFSLEIARQLPHNTAKNPRKKPESKNSEVWFFETPPVFHCFFANVNARSPLAGIIQVFGHVGRDLPTADHPRPATYCALCFSCQKTRKVMGFSGSVNGTWVFFILVFANVNGPIDFFRVYSAGFSSGPTFEQKHSSCWKI